MKSLQHVFWRGALALSLMAVGVGSGIGMPPAQVADDAECAGQTRIKVVRTHADAQLDRGAATAFVVRRLSSPAAAGS